MKCWKVASHSYWKVSIKQLILFCRRALFLHLGQMGSLFLFIKVALKMIPQIIEVLQLVVHWENYLLKYLRDRPFNLKGGGLCFFVSFRNLFSDNTRVRIFIFFVAHSRNFSSRIKHYVIWQKLWIRIFFFPPPKSEFFFQQHWYSEDFFRKKNITPPPFKSNGRSLTVFYLIVLDSHTRYL